MKKLTQRELEAVKPGQAGAILREEGNLLGRVRAKADGAVSISFYYRYRFDGKSRDVACGTWPADSLAAIRARRDDARMKVADGMDPAVEKKLLRHERQEEIALKLAEIELQRASNLTVQDLFDAWIADGVRRKDGNAELKRSFGADVLPTIGATAVKDLTEHDLRGVLRAMVDRGVNRSAVMLRDELTQMFRWARKRQPWRKLLVEGDPMDLIEIDKIVAPGFDMDYQSERVLPDTEIIELRDIFVRRQAEYDAAPNKRIVPQPLKQSTQLAVWIMLSTLCRVGETSMSRWEHVDLEAGTWFIPKANVKDSVGDLMVYLSAFALEQFRQLHKLTGHTDWCFPANSEETHIDVKAITKQLRDRQGMFNKKRDGTPRAPLKNRVSDNTMVLGGGKNGAWTSHDLRRTGATMMQKLGVSLDVIDRCQNHVLGGSKVRRHYLHHDYAEEKREAWAALGRRIEQVLAGSAGAEIIAFPRASA
jgi:integrase